MRFTEVARSSHTACTSDGTGVGPTREGRRATNAAMTDFLAAARKDRVDAASTVAGRRSAHSGEPHTPDGLVRAEVKMDMEAADRLMRFWSHRPGSGRFTRQEYGYRAQDA